MGKRRGTAIRGRRDCPGSRKKSGGGMGVGVSHRVINWTESTRTRGLRPSGQISVVLGQKIIFIGDLLTQFN